MNTQVCSILPGPCFYSDPTNLVVETSENTKVVIGCSGSPHCLCSDIPCEDRRGCIWGYYPRPIAEVIITWECIIYNIYIYIYIYIVIPGQPCTLQPMDPLHGTYGDYLIAEVWIKLLCFWQRHILHRDNHRQCGVTWSLSVHEICRVVYDHERHKWCRNRVPLHTQNRVSLHTQWWKYIQYYIIRQPVCIMHVQYYSNHMVVTRLSVHVTI